MKDHTTSTLNSQFVLQAPEVITPVSEQVAKAAVPLSADMKNAVEDQVEHFMQALLSEDLQSESFKTRLDSAFALGREEISIASGLTGCSLIPSKITLQFISIRNQAQQFLRLK